MEIKADKICKSYGAVTILENVSFSLEQGQKVGLIGYNGTGKTTLLKILAGIIEPDSGEVITRKDAIIGYMPQDTSLISNETIRDYLRRISGIAKLEEKMEKSQEAMTEYKRRNGYAFDHRLEVMLAGFGLIDISSNCKINSLSSGQKSKVFMMGVLLSDPDILLLDEPTNNLDIPALVWFESFIARTDATSIIVSHDRLFLDRIVRKIFEIDWHTKTLNIINGRYSDYLLRKEKELIQQWQKHKEQQEKIERLEDQVQKKKQKTISGSRYIGTDNDKFLRGFKREKAGKSGKQAKAIEKRIEQMEIIEKPLERDLFCIDIKPTKSKGGKEIVLVDLIAGYADSKLRIGPISLSIPYGSRIVILGVNGSGKTTLLRTISGELPPLEGKINRGNALVIGNLTQEHDNLPREESIKNFLLRKTNFTTRETYALFVKFGFKATEIDKPISSLSPGERARLLFALFSALSVNVLLLDEPTNHLDLEAIEALEKMVARYEGTILLVSHDRQFLKRFFPTDVYLLSDGKIKRQESIKTYIEKAERQAHRLINISY